tara:strand:- start:4059 stop:4844 length:786 start_codon:yes stop_codon:yes gene_type:complete
VSTRRGRPFDIKPEDVRLYYEAMYAVTQSMEWPWTERGVPSMEEPPERDDMLPPADNLLHYMNTYLNAEALQLVKAKARRDRHRQKKKPVCLHLDYDAWALRLQSAEWRMNPLVKALMCMRGFDFISAITFVAEIGDLSRFPKPAALMAYLGLVPSEHSSGNTRTQGSITKTGNQHARRILVEAAWNYRHKAHVGREIKKRQQGQAKAVCDIAWKAQLRLTHRYRHLRMGRKLHQNKVCIAIARELAGFIWDIGRQVDLPA